MSKLVIIIFSLFLIFIFITLMVLPKYRDLRILKGRVLEKETELARKEEYLGQLEFLSKKLEKYTQEFRKIDNALPNNPNLASLFEFLQKNCSQNGLVFKEIGDFRSVSAKELEGVEVTTAAFRVAGTIEAFLDFLKNLEKSARLIEISSVKFKLPEQGDVFGFDLEVKVYSEK